MAKRRNQNRKRSNPIVDATLVSGGQINNNERIDKKRLIVMFSIMSVIMIPVAMIMHATLNGDAPILKSVKDAPPKVVQEKQAGQQGQQRDLKFINPTKFGGMWDMIMYFSKDYDSKGLHHQLKQLFDFSERAYDPGRRKFPLQSGFKARGAGFDRTTRHKLEHDLEQFDFYLRSEDVGKKSHGLELFRNTLPNIYRATLNHLDDAAAREVFNEENEYYIFQEKDRDIMKYYNRAMFIPTLPPTQKFGSGLLTPRDWASVERQWFGEDVHHPHPGIVVIDNLLSPQTLLVCGKLFCEYRYSVDECILSLAGSYILMVRKMGNDACLHNSLSTIWYEPKLPRYGHYLGAYINDGMYDPEIAEIALDE